MDEIAMAQAWFSLRDLYHDEASRDLFSVALEDETGRAMTYCVLEPLIGEAYENVDRYAAEFFTLLQALLAVELKTLHVEDRESFFVEGIKKLIAHDLQLRKSFTLAECRSFIGVCDERASSDLCGLDRISGLYLCLRVLEDADPVFRVADRLIRGQELVSLVR